MSGFTSSMEPTFETAGGEEAGAGLAASALGSIRLAGVIFFVAALGCLSAFAFLVKMGALAAFGGFSAFATFALLVIAGLLSGAA
jgi:hypothetical protein